MTTSSTPPNPAAPAGPVHRRAAYAAAGLVASVAVLAAPALASAPSASAATRPAAPAPSAPAPTGGPTLALLDLAVTTSSPWASIRLNPGWIAGYSVQSNPSNLPNDEVATADGVEVANAPASGATVVIRVLYQETSGADPVAVTLAKQQAGAVSVTITNRSRMTAPFTVLTAGDTIQSGTSFTQQVTARRSSVFGPVDAPMPVADSRHLVLAAYYGWYNAGSWSNPQLADRPATGYDTANLSDVVAMSKQARSNGVSGFEVSYSGARDNTAYNTAANAAAQTGGVVAPYVEAEYANASNTADWSGPADPSIMQNWLGGLLYGGTFQPATLKAADGVPIVFVYHMQSLTPAQWASIEGALLAEGLPVHVVGDGGYPAYTGVEWGYQNYRPSGSTQAAMTANDQWSEAALRGPAAVNPAVTPKAWVATVQPGYNDTNLRGTTNPVIPRNNGATYAATWNAALATQPDMVLVTSWNEWFEGTQIQPGVATGSQALTQTGQFGAWYAAH